jgi:hypothetical protein
MPLRLQSLRLSLDARKKANGTRKVAEPPQPNANSPGKNSGLETASRKAGRAARSLRNIYIGTGRWQIQAS